MRTTIDVPDALYRDAKALMAKSGLTFRSLVIDALEQALRQKRPTRFVLREASAGYVAGKKGGAVSRRVINDAIDNLREPRRDS